jgi:EF hand
MFTRTKSAAAACIFVLAAIAASAASAQTSGSTEFPDLFWREIMMKAMDKNKDGMVTREEFMSYMGEQYDKMDQNKDAKLTRAEFMDKKMMRTTFPTSVTGP